MLVRGRCTEVEVPRGQFEGESRRPLYRGCSFILLACCHWLGMNTLIRAQDDVEWQSQRQNGKSEVSIIDKSVATNLILQRFSAYYGVVVIGPGRKSIHKLR